MFFNKNKLPKKVTLPHNYKGGWDRIPLGKSLTDTVVWDINVNNALMIFGPAKSGKSIFVRTITKYCHSNFDIHYIDLVGNDSPRYLTNITNYYTIEDANKCIDSLIQKNHQNEQLLICNNLFELFTAWRDNESMLDMKEKLLWLITNGNENNVYVVCASQVTPWEFSYDSIYWTPDWHDTFKKMIENSIVTGLSRYHRADMLEIFNVDIPNENDSGEAYIKGRGYIKLDDSSLINYQTFYTSSL